MFQVYNYEDRSAAWKYLTELSKPEGKRNKDVIKNSAMSLTKAFMVAIDSIDPQGGRISWGGKDPLGILLNTSEAIKGLSFTENEHDHLRNVLIKQVQNYRDHGSMKYEGMFMTMLNNVESCKINDGSGKLRDPKPQKPWGKN